MCKSLVLQIIVGVIPSELNMLFHLPTKPSTLVDKLSTEYPLISVGNLDFLFDNFPGNIPFHVFGLI